jgi:hypothetical protein
MQIITDPRTLDPTENPFIVLANQSNDFIGGAIDLRTELGGYHPCDHAMSCIHQGKFASQGLWFEEVDMAGYMKPGAWLAFVQLTDNNPNFSVAFHHAVEYHLSLPAYRRFYNFVEIFGQAIGAPAVSFPGLFDCSMIDVSFLQQTSAYLPAQARILINAMSKYLNPEQLWKIIVDNPGVFNVYGIYQNNPNLS